MAIFPPCCYNINFVIILLMEFVDFCVWTLFIEVKTLRKSLPFPWFARILPYSPGARPMATGTDIQTLTRGSKEEVGTAILGASKMRSKKTGEWLSRRDLKLFEVNGIDGWKWLQFGFMMDDSWVHTCKNMETSFKYVFLHLSKSKIAPHRRERWLPRTTTETVSDCAHCHCALRNKALAGSWQLCRMAIYCTFQGSALIKYVDVVWAMIF